MILFTEFKCNQLTIFKTLNLKDHQIFAKTLFEILIFQLQGMKGQNIYITYIDITPDIFTLYYNITMVLLKQLFFPLEDLIEVTHILKDNNYNIVINILKYKELHPDFNYGISNRLNNLLNNTNFKKHYKAYKNTFKQKYIVESFLKENNEYLDIYYPHILTYPIIYALKLHDMDMKDIGIIHIYLMLNNTSLNIKNYPIYLYSRIRSISKKFDLINPYLSPYVCMIDKL